MLDHDPETPPGSPATVAPVAETVPYVILVMEVPTHRAWAFVPEADVNEILQGGGPAEPQVIFPSTNETLGMTSANSSAYSQLPGEATSHFTTELPVPTTTKRRLNIRPLKDTGVRLNQAALNCLLVVEVKGALGDRLEKFVTLLKKPLAMFEFRPLTHVTADPDPVHTTLSLVVSKSIANEIAEVLIPEAILILTGKVMVSPTAQVEELNEPMLVWILKFPPPPPALTVMEPVAVLVPLVQPPVIVTV